MFPYIAPCLLCQEIILYSKYQQLCLSCCNLLCKPPLSHCIKCCMLIEPIISIDTSFNSITALHDICMNCRYNNWSFDRLFACTIYNEQAAKVALLLKYKGFGAKFIAYSIYQLILRHKIHVIVPVPLHSSRLIQRGFNQSELISIELAKLYPAIVNKNLLIRVKNTKSQEGLTQQQRAINLKNSFALNTKLSTVSHFLNLNILLIDDVVTTNATIESCSQTLKQLQCNVFVACWSKRHFAIN